MKNLLVVFVFMCVACQAKDRGQEPSASFDPPVISAAQAAKLDTAYLASGCFWCTEAVFERVEGVFDAVSGYTGGDRPNPTYQQVSAGLTNHAEAVRIVYDPEVVDYETIVRMFFASHDPTQLNRQGPDVGRQYRSGIYYRNPSEQQIAEKVKEELNTNGKYSKPVVTEIVAFKVFWEAEDYHQNYYELHPNNSYIINVSKPKVDKFVKEYQSRLKSKYQ